MSIVEFFGTKLGGMLAALIQILCLLWLVFMVGHSRGRLAGVKEGMRQAKQPIFLAAKGTKIYRLDDQIKMVKDMNGTETNNSEDK